MTISTELINLAIRSAVDASKILMKWTKREIEVVFKEDESPVTLADRDSHDIIRNLLKNSPYPILSEEGREIPYEERKNWRTFWLVDPLDGTKEFIKGRPEFTVNIALLHRNEPLLGIIAVPEQNLVYVGIQDRGAFRFRVDELSGGFDETKGTQLPDGPNSEEFRVVASRSHLSPETAAYVDELRAKHGKIEFVQAGSALKFCKLAEGAADIYPRFTPCMEWDTAAGHALLKAVGKEITQANGDTPLRYNKESLLSPFFIAG